MIKKEKIIKCPKCLTTEMEKLTNGKYQIDKCPKCEGIFLDKEEAESMSKMGIIEYIKYYIRGKRK